MAGSDNKQWFENNNSDPSKKNNSRKKSGSKKHASNKKAPASKKPASKNPAAYKGAPSNKNQNRNVASPNNKPGALYDKKAASENMKPRPIGKASKIDAPKPSNTNNTSKAKVKHEKKASRSLFGKKNNKKKIVKKEQPKKDIVKNSASETPVDTVTKPVFDQNQANLDRKKRSRKTVFNRALISLAICLAVIAVLGAIIHYLFDYIAAKPELTFISNGSVEHTIGARALIVRDEVLIPSTADGDLITQATEGSRVYSNQRIALVVPEDMQLVVDSLRNTQSQISEVQQELIQSGLADGADAIYDNFNSSLNPIIDMIRLDSMDGKISGMSSYSSSISVLLNQRETALASLDFDDERLRVLRSDETAYENQLSRNATTIRATNPGVVSFRLDGLESELSFNVLLEANSDSVYQYISNAQGVISTDLVVSNGDNVARIASNEKQYIACFLDERTATVDAFAIGSKHTINIGSEGISIGKCIVERVEPTTHGLYVVFSTTRYVEDLLDLRSVDIEVVINETEGLRVPISSLVSPDYSRNVATIYVNNQGFCDEVSVIIEDYDREFAIIAPIGDNSVPNLQTVIVTNPSSINPGDQLDG